jgi:xanthine dehydrogenase accessory factor
MAKEIITGNLNEILDKVNVSSRDFVVITYGAQPDRDYLALKKMIMKKPAYIGLLGSKARVLTLIKELKESGIGDEMLKPLHAPVGLDIGAQSPEEIGVSILAEIISARRKPSSSNEINSISHTKELKIETGSS